MDEILEQSHDDQSPIFILLKPHTHPKTTQPKNKTQQALKS